jgi:cyclic pyranopterin phosphate synthase
VSTAHSGATPLDRIGRPLTSLRLSVTDRCNLRCQYCMPEADYSWLPKGDILGFEEIVRLVRVFAALGVRRLRLTGGEPLLRRDLPALITMLAGVPGIDDLALTTNGVLLAAQASALREAGLRRLTVSLDTLDRDTFVRLARFDELARVRDGLDAAARVFPGFKIDTVVLRGVNDGEIASLVDEARTLDAELRFIEYMDVGGATLWTAAQVVSRQEILERLAGAYGGVSALPRVDRAPAERFRLGNGQVVGIIASTTEPFCRTCDRSRLTADGLWYLCLYAASGHDLRAAVRGGASDADLADLIRRTWEGRSDRGAEERLASRHRSAFVPLTSLKRDPHLEMHTRGG